MNFRDYYSSCYNLKYLIFQMFFLKTCFPRTVDIIKWVINLSTTLGFGWPQISFKKSSVVCAFRKKKDTIYLRWPIYLFIFLRNYILRKKYGSLRWTSIWIFQGDLAKNSTNKDLKSLRSPELTQVSLFFKISKRMVSEASFWM